MTIDQQTAIDDDDYDALFERGDDEEERSGGYRAQPWWYMKNEGDIAILRFLEESPDWRKAPTHRFFPTKPKAPDFEGNWPKAMPATCRGGLLAKRYPEGCPMCSSGYEGQYKKGSKTDDIRYTMAVEREQYKDENGYNRFRDKTVEVPLWNHETGEISENETITLPSIVLVGETMFRMMSAIKGTGEATGSLRSQDIRCKLIKNPNNGKGLIVQSVALAPDPTILPGTEHWDIYTHTLGLWKPRGLSLGREIMYRASPEYWDRFFLADDGRTYAEHCVRRGVDPMTSSTSSVSTASKTGTASTVEPNAEKLAAMKERITRANG